MPLSALRLRDFDISNIYYNKFIIEKMAKLETLIVPRGLRSIAETYLYALPISEKQYIHLEDETPRQLQYYEGDL